MTGDNLKQRVEQFKRMLGDLAYERLQLVRRIEAIDKDIASLEGAQQANNLTQKDLNTEAAIATAQAEAAANTDKEAPNA